MTKILSIFGLLISIILSFFSEGKTLSWLYIPWALYTVFVALITYKNDNNVNVRKFWLRPSIICFLSLIIVGYQLCIDDTLGYSSIDTTILTEASKYADYCFFSASIFVFSYIIALGKERTPLFDFWKNETNKKHAAIWLVLMVLTFVLFVSTIDIYFFLSGAAYHGSGAADYNFTISNTFEGLYQTFFYITLACYIKLISVSNRNPISFLKFLKSFPFLFWFCVILYLILRLLSGDRGPVIYNSLAIIYGFIWCTKYRFKLSTVVVTFIIGASLVSFLGTFRSRDSDLSLSEKITESINRRKEIDDKSILVATKELAESEDTHFMAVRDVANAKTDYSFGKYTLLSVTSAIPGLKRKYLYDLGLDPGELDSATYFSISSQGKNFTFGEGSSMFGEAYLEFGVFGMVLFGLLLGYIYKQIDVSLMENRFISVISLAIVLKLSAQAIYMGRTSFAIELGSVLHMIVLFYIINFVIKKIS